MEFSNSKETQRTEKTTGSSNESPSQKASRSDGRAFTEGFLCFSIELACRLVFEDFVQGVSIQSEMKRICLVGFSQNDTGWCEFKQKRASKMSSFNLAMGFTLWIGFSFSFSKIWLLKMNSKANQETIFPNKRENPFEKLHSEFVSSSECWLFFHLTTQRGLFQLLPRVAEWTDHPVLNFENI